ncbi:bacteriohemerythrin [Rhodoblastus acidophilus]|jgi:hemerythrin|uniref:Bacteriohemerythrin n=1 Tax=Rhodoblastus acidophilus TaxID=1074 RepID=A0A6N8DQI7_RHOAC|nr:bacteriohemerythrin [Rhodoblastus acidophilus]MCW2276165.1 hemerythrin [Rhodoblastus acidophilus]MTV32830.1 bacteriohemerythrin [Rhodoblastus acidophilus]
MPLMTWNEKMSLGVVGIDNQHKKLVGLVNELYDAIQAGKANAVLGRVLDELVAYTESHFRGEEELFSRARYPCSAEHKREHDALTGRVLEIQAKVRAGVQGTLSLEVMNFLKNWLIDHIQGSDRKYVAYLNAARETEISEQNQDLNVV